MKTKQFVERIVVDTIVGPLTIGGDDNYVRFVIFGSDKEADLSAEKTSMSAPLRAVGQAANKKPLPVIIPCHQLVGSSGWLGGFAPGVELKKILLNHEGVHDRLRLCRGEGKP